jgi:tRNA nucleotidyltransferase (CCA-adding enzyme)
MTRRLPQPVRVYRVGGAVRDELLGLPAGDCDWVVVGANPEMMVASGYTPVGRDFPVFLHPETRDEYALARTERKHGRGYRGFEFFATPEVTLEDDLRRRDLTINAMARDEHGTLIDPYGGERDLRDGILRHVSDAFAEDPLRVLRVARFAARFDFRIADATLELMRAIVASGELETLASERVWTELARGLCEAHPSRMLRALRACDALATLMPEIEAQYRLRLNGDDAGALTERALDWSAQHKLDLRVRYAALTQELDLVDARTANRRSTSATTRHARSANAATRAKRVAETHAAAVSTRLGMVRANALSKRLRVPLECSDAARLAARWHRKVAVAQTLAPSELLALITDIDALRRPDRLDALLESTAAHVAATHGAAGAAWDGAEASVVREAVAVVRSLDAATIARDAIERAASRSGSVVTGQPGERIRAALRDARLAALRAWKRGRDNAKVAKAGRAIRGRQRRA